MKRHSFDNYQKLQLSYTGTEFKKESTTQVSFNCSYNTGEYL
jgi:hypothetical protein